jgi:hypothetical protein
MGAEQGILHRALVQLSAEPETMCWRNNTGTAWQGEQLKRAPGAMVKVEPGMVVLRQARFIRFGLPGSGDAIGVTRGRAWSGEAKSATGRLETSQPQFRRAWERAGGVYFVFRSPEEAVAELRRSILGG